MIRTRMVLGMLALILVFGGVSLGQDKKDGKGKSNLPPNWGKLGLSDEQKQKVYAIRGDYASRIQELQAKLKELQRQELGEMMKVLTDTQREQLRTMAIEKATGGDAKKKDKQE